MKSLIVAIIIFVVGSLTQTAFAQSVDFSGAPPPPPPPSSPATPGKSEPEGANYLFNIANESYLKGDFKKAISIFESLSDDGHVMATLFLGWMHERGLGVPVDEEKALKIYKRAAALGSEPGRQAAKRLSKQKNVKKKRRAKKLGGRNQMYSKADKARRDGDLERAYEILKPSADNGDSRAQMTIGSMLYREGRGDKKNFKEAFEMYRAAAKSGSHQATMMLAMMYKRGAGVKKNLKEAVRLLKKSTDGGNRYAPHHLAAMHERGIGVPKDKDKALMLYKLSGERGYSWGTKAYERLLKE